MKHRWTHGLVGLANGAGAGKATLENGSFGDCDATNHNETYSEISQFKFNFH